MPTPGSGTIKQDLRPRKLRKSRAGGDGNEFPFRVAKVTRVDSKRMVVSLYCFTGDGDNYDNVSLLSPGAGARHFLGSIPEVNDLCVIGYSPAESGFSRLPYVVGWLVPGTDAGYDWAMTSPTREDEVPLTPALREALQGTFGRRRHKLKQMEPGNVVASSAQGADMVLNESVTLSNRRGNEITLRDQDQALVIRSLQQFHAMAGVRVYSGMVQRDATLLPTQMFGDSVKWDADKQIDSEAKALPAAELEESLDMHGVFTPADVFGSDLSMGYTDPTDILRRGLFIDENGLIYDQLVQSDAVYGGKPLYRVSVDPELNGVLDSGAEVFSEYRIEVSHTSDGTLPVTEQTDGVDIDRLLPSAPTTGIDGSGDPNPLNQSPNRAFVSMVLGTAIGNDPIGDRSNYGRPLVPSLYDENGTFSPGVRAAGADTPISEHAAWLLRVRNPTDPKAPEAFMAITKGGSYRSYFPGYQAHEEFYQAGKQISLGSNTQGQSWRAEADGTISLKNTGKGRPVDNVGVELRSEGGAVSIFGGGASQEGGGTPSSDPNLTPAGSAFGVIIRSAKGALLESRETTKVSGQRVLISDADSIEETANTSIAMNAGDTISANSKVFSVTTTGKAEYTFGGPKDASSTNGPCRSTKFTSTSSTGGTGGVVDEYEIVYGGRKETLRQGRHETIVKDGSFNVTTMTSGSSSVGAGSGIHLNTGRSSQDSRLDLDEDGAKLTANTGNVTVQATKGQAVIRGSTGVALKSPQSISLTSSLINVKTSTPYTGGVLTDGCLNSLTGRSFFLSGTLGVASFQVSS